MWCIARTVFEQLMSINGVLGMPGLFRFLYKGWLYCPRRDVYVPGCPFGVRRCFPIGCTGKLSVYSSFGWASINSCNRSCVTKTKSQRESLIDHMLLMGYMYCNLHAALLLRFDHGQLTLGKEGGRDAGRNTAIKLCMWETVVSIGNTCDITMVFASIYWQTSWPDSISPVTNS